MIKEYKRNIAAVTMKMESMGVTAKQDLKHVTAKMEQLEQQVAAHKHEAATHKRKALTEKRRYFTDAMRTNEWFSNRGLNAEFQLVQERDICKLLKFNGRTLPKLSTLNPCDMRRHFSTVLK